MANHQKPAESLIETDLLTWLTKFDILNESGKWQCGAPTKRKLCCGSSSHIKEKMEVEKKIRKITLPTQAPHPHIKEELVAIAKLIHCNNHGHGTAEAIEDRVNVWQEQLSGVGPPVDEKIRKMFGEPYIKCLLGIEQCSDFQRIGGMKVRNITRMIDEIVKPEVYSHPNRLRSFLQTLESLWYCERHNTEKSPERVEEWASEIEQFCKQNGQDAATYIESDPAEDLRNQARSSNTEAGNLSTEMTNLCVRDPDQSLSWDCESSVFGIVANVNPKSRRTLIEEELVKPITYKLDQKEQNDEGKGYVYLYQVEGNPDFVKVGWTRDLDQRRKQWEFVCNRRIVKWCESKLVPHAARVEKLCHADLDGYRVRFRCGGCLEYHTEWFRVSIDEGTRVIKRWSEWMRQDPYQVTQLKVKERSRRILEEI